MGAQSRTLPCRRRVRRQESRLFLAELWAPCQGTERACGYPNGVGRPGTGRQIRQIEDARLKRIEQAPSDGPHAMVSAWRSSRPVVVGYGSVSSWRRPITDGAARKLGLPGPDDIPAGQRNGVIRSGEAQPNYGGLWGWIVLRHWCDAVGCRSRHSICFRPFRSPRWTALHRRSA
jgi:hypothetical protein